MKNRYLDGLALGIAIGFAASIGVVWVLEDGIEPVRKFLVDHITHVVTLLAAALALLGMSRQMQSNIELAEQNRLSRLDAAKATLPIVLSNISKISEERFYSIAFGKSTPAPDMRWEISDFELSTLKECIENAGGFEKELMLEVIRVYQVLMARWDSLELVKLFGAAEVPSGDPALFDRLNQCHAIANWVALRAIAHSLFDYARGVPSAPSYDKMIAATLRTLDHIHSGGLAGTGGFISQKQRQLPGIRRAT